MLSSQTGTEHLFKLLGADIFAVTDCQPLDSTQETELSVSTDYLDKIEEFTIRLSRCAGLESILSTALDALSDLFGFHHCFVMVPDESRERLFTLRATGLKALAQVPKYVSERG